MNLKQTQQQVSRKQLNNYEEELFLNFFFDLFRNTYHLYIYINSKKKKNKQKHKITLFIPLLMRIDKTGYFFKSYRIKKEIYFFS